MCLFFRLLLEKWRRKLIKCRHSQCQKVKLPLPSRERVGVRGETQNWYYFWAFYPLPNPPPARERGLFLAYWHCRSFPNVSIGNLLNATRFPLKAYGNDEIVCREFYFYKRDKSAILRNRFLSWFNKAKRLFLSFSSSAITITPSKKLSTSSRKPAKDVSADE